MAVHAEQGPGGEDSAVIVLLAAGASRRYGSPKQLALINGEPMLRRVARIALGARVPVLVVLGAQADATRSTLDGLAVSVVHCADWAEGMGRSLAAGAAAVERTFPHASGLLVCLADQPLMETHMFIQLLCRHRDAPQKILATGHDDAVGPPVLFPRDCMAELAQWSATGGARDLLKRESHRVERCLTNVGTDVDTPAAMDEVNRVLTARDALVRD